MFSKKCLFANSLLLAAPLLGNLCVFNDYTMSTPHFRFLRYGKYKPLSQPAKCKRCSEKRIKSAYHQFCAECVKETGGCAKCGQTEMSLVNPPQPTPAESAQMESELQKELKLLPERKRRTFMRYLQQQEKSEIGFLKYFTS